MNSRGDKVTRWQPCAAPLRDDRVLRETILAVYQDRYLHYFVNQSTINPRLPIEVRAFRRIDRWRVFLLLTPWMLVRAWVSESATKFAIPQGWSATERDSAPYTLLGPVFNFVVLNSVQKVHLAYERQIGHYFIQPLILSVESYDSARSVYDAWRQLVKTRIQKLAYQKNASKWHSEISRREFFTKLVTT